MRRRPSRNPRPRHGPAPRRGIAVRCGAAAADGDLGRSGRRTRRGCGPSTRATTRATSPRMARPGRCTPSCPMPVAGIRALLMQALHPGAMAGVHDWSRYRKDPLCRLTGTIRWILCLTFGSRAQADPRRHGSPVPCPRDRRYATGTERGHLLGARRRARRLGALRLHRGVPPAHTSGVGRSPVAPTPTSPTGPSPGAWSASTTRRPAPSCMSGSRLPRARRPPRRRARARRAAFLRRPPITGRMGLAYRMLFASATATIPRRYRRLLGIRRIPLPVITATRVVLVVADRALNSGGPRANDRARERLRRLEGERG